MWCWCPVATCASAQDALPCCSNQTVPCAAARCRPACVWSCRIVSTYATSQQPLLLRYKWVYFSQAAGCYDTGEAHDNELCSFYLRLQEAILLCTTP